MRARHRPEQVRQWLMCALLTATWGCASPSDRASRTVTLSTDELTEARALAHYASGLLFEGENGQARVMALRHFTRAAELSPGQHFLYAKVASECLLNNMTDQGISILEKSLRESPDKFMAHIDLAGAYHFAGNTNAAITHYMGAMNIDDTRLPLYRELAKMLFAAGRDADALKLFDRRINDPEIGDQIRALCYGFGITLVQQEAPARALPCFERILPFTDRRTPRLWLLIGQLHETIGKLDQATDAYMKAIAGDDPPRDAYLRLAFLKAQSAPAAAVDLLQEAERVYRENTPQPLATSTLNIAVPLTLADPQCVIPLLEASNCALPPELQIPIEDTVIQLSARALTSEPAKAIDLLEAALRWKQNSPLILRVLGQVYSSVGRHEDALACYEHLVSLADASIEIFTDAFYLLYGSACEQTGKYEKAMDLFERCLESYPEAHEVMNYLAYMWAERGLNLDRAMAYANRALIHQPRNAAYLDTRGWIHFRMGNFREALVDLQAADAFMPGDPTILDHIGDAWSALGHRESAIAKWTLSLRADPSNQRVAEKLRANGIQPTELSLPADATTRKAEELD